MYEMYRRSDPLLIASIEARSNLPDGRKKEGKEAISKLVDKLKSLSRKELEEEYLRLWPEKAQAVVVSKKGVLTKTLAESTTNQESLGRVDEEWRLWGFLAFIAVCSKCSCMTTLYARRNGKALTLEWDKHYKMRDGVLFHRPSTLNASAVCGGKVILFGTVPKEYELV